MVELNESSALPLNSNKGKGTDFQNLPEVAFNLGWEQVQALGDSNPKWVHGRTLDAMPILRRPQGRWHGPDTT